MEKIVICIPSLAHAGAERFVTEVACGINKKEFNVKVVVTQEIDEKSSFYKKLVENDITVISNHSANKFKMLVFLYRFLIKEKPDVIHTNVGACFHILIPQLLSRCKATHLFTTHSMGYRLVSKRKSLILKYLFKKRLVIPVAICDTVKDSISKYYSIDNDYIECVYNGVDTNIFYPHHERKITNEIIYINVGTLYTIKNHVLLIDAFSIVNKLNNNTKLLIVGDGDLRKDLERKIKEMQLDNSVLLVGNRSNVQDYLNMADIYCSTSTVEGLPISVLEAMATGLPIVTTPAGGVVDIVDDKCNGYVVDWDPMKIANAMLEIANDSALRNRMGAASRERSLHYNLVNCVEGYEHLYRKYKKTFINKRSSENTEIREES